MKGVVDALVGLGFALNEGRAYAALLEHGASTGYEVAQRAGIPRSAVYGALRQLVAEGAARSVPGPPERFVASPPAAITGALRGRFERTATALEEAARALSRAPDVPDAFSVRGTDRILEEAARIVSAAEEKLVLSGWPRELGRLAPELAEADARGVFVVVFSHARLPDEIAGLRFSTGAEEAALEAFWKHRLVVVADDRSTLIGATEGLPSDRAVVSETDAIAEITVSQVALDVTLLAARHGFDTQAVMAKMLGDRVGRLGAVLADGASPELGRRVPAPAGGKAGARRGGGR